MKKGVTYSTSKNWKLVKLPDAVFFQEGPGLRKFQYTKTGVPFLNIRTLVNERIDTSLCGHISAKEVEEKYQHFLLNEGDIICSTSGTLGKLAIVHKEDLPLLLNTSVMRFRTKDTSVVSDRYIFYFLKSELFISQARDAATGQAQINFGPSHLKKFIFPLPPLPEQKRIVSLLDETFAALAQVGANAARNLVNAREVFEAELNVIFGNGKDWEIGKLGDIGKVSMCKRVFKEQTTTIGDIPFYKIGTFGKEPDAYISKEIYDEFRKNYSFPKKGDILISASGTIGRRVKYDGEPAYFQDSNIVWIDNDEKQVLNDYLYHFYGACNWNSTKGATIARLYTTNLKQLEIVFPKSLGEQRAIVQRLEGLSKETHRLEAVYRQKMEDVEELRKSVLREAFTPSQPPPNPT